jgi:hypothetical protein
MHWIAGLLAKSAWCLAVDHRKHAARFLDEAVSAITRIEGASVVYVGQAQIDRRARIAGGQQ